MKTVATKLGKCMSYGDCSLASPNKTIEIPPGQDFICPECHKPLQPVEEPKGVSPLLIGGIVAVLALGGGGGYWYTSSHKTAPAPQTSTPAAVETPVPPPITGDCSPEDEQRRLCQKKH